VGPAEGNEAVLTIRRVCASRDDQRDRAAPGRCGYRARTKSAKRRAAAIHGARRTVMAVTFVCAIPRHV
jgi:hypothetical protein